MQSSEALQKLCADENIDNNVRAARILEAAFRWCAEIVTPGFVEDAARSGPARIQALRVLVHVSAAFEAGQVFLALFSLPGFLEPLRAGANLEQTLQDQSEAVRIGATNLARLRADVEALHSNEETLHSQHVEREHLLAEKFRLEHLAELLGDLEDLQIQVSGLKERLAQADQVEQYELGIHESAEALVVLSDEALARLRPQARQALRRAAEQEVAVCAIQADVAAAERRYEQASALQKDRLPVLRLYHEADSIVAASLPTSKRPDELLNRVDELLSDADAALKSALEAKAQTELLPRLPY